jgi:hypothetical protein
MSRSEVELNNYALSIFGESNYFCVRRKKGWYLYHKTSDEPPFYLGKNKQNAKKAILEIDYRTLPQR